MTTKNQKKVYPELGRRVQKIRKGMGLTQPVFWRFLFPDKKYKTEGSETTHMSDLERGEDWTIEKVAYVAKKLGVSTDYLLLGKNREYSLRDWAKFLCYTLPRAFNTDIKIDRQKFTDCLCGMSEDHKFSFDITLSMLLYPVYDSNREETGRYELDPRYAEFIKAIMEIQGIMNIGWSNNPKELEKQAQRALNAVSDTLAKVDKHPYDINDFDP